MVSKTICASTSSLCRNSSEEIENCRPNLDGDLDALEVEFDDSDAGFFFVTLAPVAILDWETLGVVLGGAVAVVKGPVDEAVGGLVLFWELELRAVLSLALNCCDDGGWLLGLRKSLTNLFNEMGIKKKA